VNWQMGNDDVIFFFQNKKFKKLYRNFLISSRKNLKARLHVKHIIIPDIIKTVFDMFKVQKTLSNTLKHVYCEHLLACCASANSANLIGQRIERASSNIIFLLHVAGSRTSRNIFDNVQDCMLKYYTPREVQPNILSGGSVSSFGV